ncbi:protein kinase [Trypanosoma grayi]|uniref:protein kinase n=1 Tax=Trypanosoma grayi TaxID=71804 RepID=UPI0004F49466|nr:protein kinase [Trypanosoma grayi]KEG08948.1 protein kinase [Trypanosoma grayi]
MNQRFGPYQVGETVGRGTFGKVKLAVHEATQTKVALKVIPRRLMEQDARSGTKITREIKILKLLQHPNIMRLYDVVQTKHDIVLILEYVSGGELFDYICRKGRLAEDVARHLFQQIVAGVAYCHRYRVAHRDLKPENIMMEHGSTTIKIGDFGLSSVSHDGCFFETSCGTPNYASPEVVSGKLYGGPETDVWSCGVVLYTMLAGALPFDNNNVAALFKLIQTANYVMPSGLSGAAQDLIRRMLVVNPLERATMEQVMQHPWVADAFPPHLLTLHYEAILDTVRFAKGTLLEESTFDNSVIAAVATRFGMSQQEAASIIAVHEKRNSPLFNGEVFEDGGDTKRYPAADFFEKYSNAVDAKLWPTPLVIPPAEQALRDDEHDVYVSYLILLHRKMGHMPLERLAQLGARSEAAGSLILTQSMTQGYGSLNANSLHQIPMGIASLPRSYQSSHQQGAHDSIRAHKDGGITFCGSLPAHVQSEQQGSEVVDTYVEGYNRLAETFLPLYHHSSNHTLLGKLLGVVERPFATRPKSTMPQQVQTAAPSAGGGGGGGLLQPLLKPMTGETEASSTTSSGSKPLLHPASATKARKSKGEEDDKRRMSAREQGAPSVPVQPLDVYRCDVVARFGNDFVRNGVLFSSSEPPTTLRYVYNAMREEGLLWKPIYPYFFAAVKHPSVKLQVKMYKVTAEEQIVDVKVSCQSGMQACDVASKLLERLRKKAIAHDRKRLKRNIMMGDQSLPQGGADPATAAAVADAESIDSAGIDRRAQHVFPSAAK